MQGGKLTLFSRLYSHVCGDVKYTVGTVLSGDDDK